eukprot:4431346-Pleurochrysis_carterae.AAC.2
MLRCTSRYNLEVTSTLLIGIRYAKEARISRVRSACRTVLQGAAAALATYALWLETWRLHTYDSVLFHAFSSRNHMHYPTIP